MHSITCNVLIDMKMDGGAKLEGQYMNIAQNIAKHIFNVVMHIFMIDMYTFLLLPYHMLSETYAYHVA